MTNDLISTFFEQDHREIDALLSAVPFETPKDALAKFQEFDCRLERHIGWEEGILFPAVSAKEACLEPGPIRVMKLEHAEIRREKAAALVALREGRGAASKGHVQAMLAVLKGHNMKEEQILYPACDNLLTPAERAAVFQRLRAGAAA
ncbi:MAG: hemerythrin domain-containing protein [Elusimicrobia bacterium]|nr:hemerythrin domain-containing protein [Elusimicrobiota bacterium]